MDRPGEATADSHVASAERRPSAGASDSERAAASKVSRSLIAVATTSASEASACERVCGSLGDCLLSDPDYASASAGALELACLDICVHSPDAASVKAEFLACGQHSECTSLQACAERNWTALASARRGPEVSGIVVADPCKLGCQWTYSCSQTGLPPGVGRLDPVYQQYADLCAEACDTMQTIDRDWYIHMGQCLQVNCSLEHYAACFSW